MKIIRLLSVFAILSTLLVNASAVVFTEDAILPPFDATFEGHDIVISNCTLTVDGLHSFASVQVASGGVLTHSFIPSGSRTFTTPILDESRTLTGTNAVTLASTNVLPGSVVVTDESGTMTFTNSVDYTVTQPGDGSTALQRTEASAIPDGAVVLVSYQIVTGSVQAGLTLVITNELVVATGGAILADGRGYGPDFGAGRGGVAGSPQSGGGGGHAGYGGLSSSNALGGGSYGSIENPTTLGSGGGAGYGGGGAGGGAINLTVGGTVTVHGIVSANGANATNSRAGGGAGGSISIMAAGLSGNGAISANGGNGEPMHGGGGAGGRICLESSTNGFGGRMQAVGGVGFQRGGAGTVFTRQIEDSVGVLTIDNDGFVGAMTLFSSTNAPTLVVGGGAVVSPNTNQTVASLLVRSNGWISCLGTPGTMNLTVSGSAQILAGGGIDADARGYPYAQGSGAGRIYVSGSIAACGGGGHAGYGGMGGRTNSSLGGVYYGILSQPNLAGSGGGGNSTFPGGAGGGVVRLTVEGTLHLDGGISANGARPLSTFAGGGSGGSVCLTVGTLSGAGAISAHGGSALSPSGGGGSGGRIAVFFSTNSFTGTLAAFGGTGFQSGAAGTVYTKTNGVSVGQALVDNGAVAGTNTFLGSGDSVDLTIQGNGVVGGIGFVVGSSYLNSLIVRPNSALALPGLSQTVTVARDARIERGGVMSMDGMGYGYGSGSGYGRYFGSGDSGSGGGGAHGGNGGRSFDGASGGVAYGSADSPFAAGSGGGSYSSSTFPSGSGGGALRLNVYGVLQVDGRISSSGLSAVGARYPGGGAGGSLWLTVGSLAGSGQMTANGGDGKLPNGGGGGGGRIAVILQGSNAFTGTITAQGGAGYVAGGAGSVYLKGSRDQYAQVTLDNGGTLGASSTFPSSQTVDLTIRAGAFITNSYGGGLNVRDLVIGSNSWFLASGPYSYYSVSVSRNATIEAGGGISGDGLASSGASGQGSYQSSSPSPSGGGGGNGGFGGNGASGTSSAGGISRLNYGSELTQPNGSGGAGGSASASVLRSPGGGYVRVTVNGLLKLDGSISANGISGRMDGAGGGAGGSIWLTTGGLAGSGVLSADGGMGDFPNGGGGGGGRIGLYFTSNTFSGTISAKGGIGFVSGGAGTIYTKQSSQNTGRLLVDNNGLRGTNTLVASTTPASDVVVQGGGAAVVAGSMTVRNLDVFSNASVVISNNSLSVNADATVHAGASIHADGTGYGPGVGPGAGTYAQTPRGGGSHAGLGGANPAAYASGSILNPTSGGSGGGNDGSSPKTGVLGGAGGGAIRVNVTGELTVEGGISGDGTAGGANSGGGAGGSVWLTVGTLAGSGNISASGGAGNGTAGGGGGGRVAINFKTNLFNGSVTAFGGAGSVAGGAGTIYWEQTNSTNRWLVVDNGGTHGTNTPLFGVPAGLDVRVGGGAKAYGQGSLPIFGRLTVSAGGLFTSSPGSNSLQLSTTSDLTIEPGGAVSVDAKGYPSRSGPGAGSLLSLQGGGAGHGGAGGAAMYGAPGGTTYGSQEKPVERGSGGGAASIGGSEGGGAIRLSVGGVLNVRGDLSANGNFGWQDDSGGGAGGSIWVTANAVNGDGIISAFGGDGELFNGGGGGGGRIAIYSPANTFAGTASALGGNGANSGQYGSVLILGALPGLEVLSHSPVGLVSNVVSAVVLTFNDGLNPNSISADDFILFTPAGPQANVTASASGLSSVRLDFPAQNLLGNYLIVAGPGLENLFGNPMSQVYTGAYSITLPTISGTVMDANGQPVPNVIMKPDSLMSVSTDSSGNYTLGVPPGWDGNVTPTLGSFTFVPRARNYQNVSEPLTNEHYQMFETIVPQLGFMLGPTNILLNWWGINGVTYEVLSSTNLVNWNVLSGAVAGTNGSIQEDLQITNAPKLFYRVRALNDIAR